MRTPVFRPCAAAALALMSAACARQPAVSDLTREFVYTTLEFSPTAATAAGLHDYNGLHLDSLLDDFSPASLSRQRMFYDDFNRRLAKIGPEKLSAEDAADYALLEDRTGLALLDLDRIQTPLHHPELYAETLRNALLAPYTLKYAPLEERFRDIVSRLETIPRFLDPVAGNLIDVPAVWCKRAIEENQANIDLVDRELRNAAPAEIRLQYDSAAEAALPALRKFQDLLVNKLQYLDNYDWRLGRDLYSRKFRLALESAGSPQDLLEAAETEMVEIRAHMYSLALPLYRKLRLAKDVDQMQSFERQQTVIGAVLADIAKRHPAPEAYIGEGRNDLEEARAFVRKTGMVNLPAEENLQFAATPPFERGACPAAGFHAAPPLAPRLSAFYWLTPVPSDWPKERIESQLETYNSYRLKLLALSEAIPGRWVEMQTASAIEPAPRRLLRTLYGSSAYVDGWAEFATGQAVGAGYPDRSPEAELIFDKERLRVTLNAVLDVRLHTLGMTDEDAMETMESGAFQDAAEAADNLRRAKLTSCELPAAYVGWAKWLRALSNYQAQRGGTAAEFENRALKEGAVPLSQLVSVLTR